MKIWAARQTWVAKNAAKKADTLNRNEVTRIAVIKHAALGDLLQTRPLLIALKEAFPNATLTLSVVTHYMHGIPEDLIDHLHVAKGNEKKYKFMNSLISYRDLGFQDILFDISATSRSFWITKFTPATLKIGFTHRNLHKILYDIAIPRAHYRFEAETFLEQANVIGVQHDWPLRYDYALPKRIHEKAYLAFFATASAPDKCWPPEYMAELISKSCVEHPNLDHLLLTGLADWEAETVRLIASKVGEHNNFKVMESGPDIFSFVCHADALVINDTGLRHLAIAADTPTVCIFPISSHVFGYSPLFGKHRAIVSSESEPASVEKVANAIDEIIA